MRRLSWQKRALKTFHLKTGLGKIQGKNCFTALLQTKAKFCQTFINFFCSFCEQWRYKELKVAQGLNLSQIATRVFLPTYMKIHQGWQYDQPYSSILIPNRIGICTIDGIPPRIHLSTPFQPFSPPFRSTSATTEDMFWKLGALQAFIRELNWPDPVFAEHLDHRLKLMAADMIESCGKR